MTCLTTHHNAFKERGFIISQMIVMADLDRETIDATMDLLVIYKLINQSINIPRPLVMRQVMLETHDRH
jgi:hypothetical protein